MRLIKYIILILLLLCSFNVIIAIEIRSLWVTPWSLTSQEKIDELIEDAIANNQNEILAEVRYRSDAMYIPNKFNSHFNNPEPRSYLIKDEEFDPLEYLLKNAHDVGITVQAWISVLNATQTNKDLLRSNYIYQNHSNWILTDSIGRRMNGNKYMGNFIDPGKMEVRNYLLNVMLDIVANYPELDGVHLDYIRYPDAQYGISGESVRRFKEANQSEFISWNEWRLMQVTELVKDFREKALILHPELIISAAVFADIDDARNSYAQDWIYWLQEGIIDRAYPMAYAKKNINFQRVVDKIAKESDKEKVIIGLRAWQDNYPKIDYGVEQIIDKARLCRQIGFAGIALFSYDGVKKSGYFSQLTNAIYDMIEPADNVFDDESFIQRITSRSSSSVASDTLDLNLNKFGHKSVKIMDSSNTPDDSESTKSYFDSITLHGNNYLITLFIDKESIWEWEIIDRNGLVLYQIKKFYPKGYYTEEWMGKTLDNVSILPGVYTLRLFNHDKSLINEKKILVY